MSKQELESRLQELKNEGYGTCKDLAKELEYTIIEQSLYDMKDNDIFVEDTELMATSLIEHIFVDHLHDCIEKEED